MGSECPHKVVSAPGRSTPGRGLTQLSWCAGARNAAPGRAVQPLELSGGAGGQRCPGVLTGSLPASGAASGAGPVLGRAAAWFVCGCEPLCRGRRQPHSPDPQLAESRGRSPSAPLQRLGPAGSKVSRDRHGVCLAGGSERQCRRPGPPSWPL